MGYSCSSCRQFVFENEQHECPPAWFVWCPEDGEDESSARTLYASDGTEAAKLWAQVDDVESADYRVAGGEDLVVHVRRTTGGPVNRYRVSAEAIPTYAAHLLPAMEWRSRPPCECGSDDAVAGGKPS